jgi:hypothetical protein
VKPGSTVGVALGLDVTPGEVDTDGVLSGARVDLSIGNPLHPASASDTTTITAALRVVAMLTG